MLNHHVLSLEHTSVGITMFTFSYMNTPEVSACTLIFFFDSVLGLWYILFIILGFQLGWQNPRHNASPAMARKKLHLSGGSLQPSDWRRYVVDQRLSKFLLLAVSE